MVPSWFYRLLAGVAIILSTNALQVPVADVGLKEPENDLVLQVKDLQKNVTDLWTYIIDLRQAMEQHLTHLSQHQKAVDTVLHRMIHQEHHGHDDSHHTDDHSSHSDSGHHHDGDHHGAESRQDHHDDHHSTSENLHDHGSSDSDHHHSVDSTSHSDAGHHDDDHHGDHHHDDSHHHADHQTSSDKDHHHEGDSQTSGSHDHHQDHQTSESHDHHHDHSSDSHDHQPSGSHDHQPSGSHDHQPSGSHDHHHDHNEHTSGGHAHQDSHEDHHDHKDSHEQGSVEDQQQTQGVEKLSTAVEVVEVQQPEVIEKLATASSHAHHHGHGDSNKPEQPAGSDPLNLLGGHDHHHPHHHPHHHHHTLQKNSSEVVLPKVSDYKLYDYAICDVQPNRAIAEELQQDVRGQVSLWQKKTGGPLNVHLRLRGFKIGDHHGHQMQDNEQETPPPEHTGGHRHGFHVHDSGDLSDGCQSAGPHYNPLNVTHGGPRAVIRHVGDLGNIECDNNGVTNIVFTDSVAMLSGDHSILGRAIVVHSDEDDYGLKRDDPESLRTGNAGTRIACCVIQKVDKLPLKLYKAMKSATRYRN